MPDDSLRLAVLIDADNASAAVIGDILSEGRVARDRQCKARVWRLHDIKPA